MVLPRAQRRHVVTTHGDQTTQRQPEFSQKNLVLSHAQRRWSKRKNTVRGDGDELQLRVSEITQDDQTFRFSDLPPELRKTVYEFYMPTPPSVHRFGKEEDVILQINKHGELVVPGAFDPYFDYFHIDGVIALTNTSRQMRYETRGFVHSAVSKEGLIHAQIEPYNFGPLNARLDLISAEHNIAMNELRDPGRVMISVIGTPTLGLLLKHIERHGDEQCLEKDGFCSCFIARTNTHLPSHRGYVISVWYGQASVHQVVDTYISHRSKGDKKTWKRLAEKFLQDLRDIDIEIPRPEPTGNFHSQYKKDKLYPLLSQVFDKVVGIHHLVAVSGDALERGSKGVFKSKLLLMLDAVLIFNIHASY